MKKQNALEFIKSIVEYIENKTYLTSGEFLMVSVNHMDENLLEELMNTLTEDSHNMDWNFFLDEDGKYIYLVMGNWTGE